MASIPGNLLQVTVQGTQLLSVANIALEEDNGTDSVILDERADIVIDLGVVEANDQKLVFKAC